MAARKVSRLPVPETGRIWTSQEIAHRWSATNDIVERMCRRGAIRGAFKVGRQWRLSEESLVAYERGENPFGSTAFASMSTVGQAAS